MAITTMVRGKGFRAGLLLALWLLGAPAFAEDWVYRVRPGDTLWDLGGAYLKPGVAWQRLQQHNRIADPYRLPPGSRLRFPLAWLRQQPARAQVAAVQGQATVDGGTDGDGERAVVAGMELGAGSRLVTAAGASISLRFADGSQLRMRERSELVLDRMSRYGRTGMVDTRVRLQRGRVNNEVNRLRGPGARFIVDTPTASSAVRGTRFRVHSNGDRTRAEVLEGRVAVSAGRQAAMLGRGFGALAGDGGALAPVALLPAPDLAGIGKEPDSARPRFVWPALAGAAGYRLIVSARPDFGTTLVDMVTQRPEAELPAALESGQYHLQVRGIDAAGLEGHDAETRFRIDAQPAPPYAIAPVADGWVRETRPTLRWTQAPDARSYRYEVADNPDFRNPLAAASQVHAQAATVAQDLAPGAYYWRVGSIDAQGKTGPYADAIAFTVRPLDPIDDIGRDETEGRTRAITFRWRAGQAGQRYRFQMSRSPDFRRLRVDEVVGQPEITLDRLAGGTWYLRAQAIDTNGDVGAFAEPQKVKLPCRLCRIGAGAGAVILLLTL